jgi:hypothetical protein
VCQSEHQLTARPVIFMSGAPTLWPQAGSATMTIEVELLVYSGRPNPRVELDASLAAEFTTRLGALGPLDHEFSADGRLGYRGLRVSFAAGPTIQEVEISAGAVRIHDRTGATWDLADPQREFELWVLDRLGTRDASAERPLFDAIRVQVEGTRAPRTLRDAPGAARTMTDAERGRSLVGTWRKTTGASCADKYPAVLTFSTGTYRGTRAPDQGMVWWDAGIYRLEDDRTLVLGTATDELVTYQFVLQGNEFEAIDPDGCRVTYQRTTNTP